jgi:type IV/VI secretion system ImpK/VasF family protein
VRLAELTEPLFQYACLLSRAGRRGATQSLNQVRSEVQSLFDDMAAKAAAEPKLRAAYERVDLVLAIFIDETIKQSGLKFAKEWPDLAKEKGEEFGDERFFDLLDDTLKDPTPPATEALGIFYTCLGLGFTGWYAGKGDHLRKRLREIAAKLRISPETERAGSRIVPEAYEHVDTSNLIQSPGASLLGIAIALVGLTIVLFVANAYLYRTSSHDLNRAVSDIATLK